MPSRRAACEAACGIPPWTACPTVDPPRGACLGERTGALALIRNFRLGRHVVQLFKRRVFADKADEIIYRSTGLLRDFNMDVCLRVLEHERPALSDAETLKLLARYHAHVSYWNVPLDVIMDELHWFAKAACKDEGRVFDRFDALTRERFSVLGERRLVLK